MLTLGWCQAPTVVWWQPQIDSQLLEHSGLTDIVVGDSLLDNDQEIQATTYFAKRAARAAHSVETAYANVVISRHA